jgi:hypothetical protein
METPIPDAPVDGVPAIPSDALIPPAPIAPAANEPTPESIAARLSSSEAVAAQVATPDAPSAAPDAPVIDFTKMSPAQLQQLKAMLAVTGDNGLDPTPQNPKILLRKYITFDAAGVESSKIIVHIKNAIQTLKYDEERNMNVETMMIPVQFLENGVPVDTQGITQPKYTTIAYNSFMRAPQIACEVIKRDDKPGVIYEEGEVMSNETGQMIKRVIKTLDTVFTVKLPDDITKEDGTPVGTIQVPALMANA